MPQPPRWRSWLERALPGRRGRPGQGRRSDPAPSRGSGVREVDLRGLGRAGSGTVPACDPAATAWEGVDPAPAGAGPAAALAGSAGSGGSGRARAMLRGLAPAPRKAVPQWELVPELAGVPVPTGVQRRRARQAARRELGWHGRFVIAHLGQLGPAEGVETLVPALRHLAGVQPDVLVSFLGQGSRREAVTAATAGLATVEVREPVPPIAYPAVLLGADLLLICACGQGARQWLPDTLTPYLASGRPILAVADPGSSVALELVRSGAGVLVGARDPLGLTAQVAALRADPALRTQLGDAGMRYAGRRLLSGQDRASGAG